MSGSTSEGHGNANSDSGRSRNNPDLPNGGVRKSGGLCKRRGGHGGGHASGHAGGHGGGHGGGHASGHGTSHASSNGKGQTRNQRQKDKKFRERVSSCEDLAEVAMGLAEEGSRLFLGDEESEEIEPTTTNGDTSAVATEIAGATDIDNSSTSATGDESSTNATQLGTSTIGTEVDTSTGATGVDTSTGATGVDTSTGATEVDYSTNATEVGMSTDTTQVPSKQKSKLSSNGYINKFAVAVSPEDFEYRDEAFFTGKTAIRLPSGDLMICDKTTYANCYYPESTSGSSVRQILTRSTTLSRDTVGGDNGAAETESQGAPDFGGIKLTTIVRPESFLHRLEEDVKAFRLESGQLVICDTDKKDCSSAGSDNASNIATTDSTASTGIEPRAEVGDNDTRFATVVSPDSFVYGFEPGKVAYRRPSGQLVVCNEGYENCSASGVE
ncbi:hypothetical protein DCS_04219 [Drechmeria coniospora]|uniref:Uncharacterized protein n=1 Tax=Drechmeria coniospora TaxID=98403 RepID=A0A151GJM3_DRECN|nr:hypothetical protein DCS_04219 [Drechmeria coniospora]KYK57212.1 hypothetical protein DCS_04219 [Drechmeria coniospora]